MTDVPLVSVIIPSFNEERFIKSCLDSIFLQSYPTKFVEVFVVDGGSTDNTVEIVRYMQVDHCNLFLLMNEKKIPPAAFNLGVENANGEVIIRMDAHSVYDIDYIHYCVLDLLNSGYGNVGGRLKALPGSDTLIGEVIAIINNSPFGLGGATYRIGNHMKTVKTVPFGAFPKKIVLLIGKMDELEDNGYNARIRAIGYKILFDPRIVFYYYARSTLRLFLSQAQRNGLSVGRLCHKSLYSYCIRHFTPMIFVIFLGFGLILSFLFPVFRIIVISCLILYFLLNFVFGIIYVKKNRIKIIPLLAIITFLVHIYYGVGTIKGFIKSSFKCGS